MIMAETTGVSAPSTRPTPTPSRRSASRHHRRQKALFLLMLVAPAVLFAGAVCVYPLVSAFSLSFFDYDLKHAAAGPQFVGFDNYARFLADPLGRQAIVNTLTFAVAAVTVELVLGLAIALMLWRDTRFNKVVTALFLVPVAFTPLVGALLFKNLYSTTYGPLGVIVNALAGGNLDSLVTNPVTAMPAIILVDVWQWTPLIALTLLGGLRSLPDEVIEAAALDGAGYWRRLFAMVLPQLSSFIFIAVVIRTMDAFKVFDSIYAITGGGPGNATTTLNYLAFTEGLQFFNVGYASAISNVLLIIIVAFSAVYVFSLNRLNRKYETH
jgi:multiple sugar transport system permease protein